MGGKKKYTFSQFKGRFTQSHSQHFQLAMLGNITSHDQQISANTGSAYNSR